MPSPAATTRTDRPPETGCSRSARALVEAHFAARLAPEGEVGLRAHLERCDDCRAAYERHLLLAKLDPAVAPAEARLAVGLGLAPRRRSPVSPLFGGVALAAAAAVALFVAVPRGGERAASDADFQARGPGAVAPVPARLGVYRVDGTGARSPLAAAERVPAQAELAFTYTNRDSKKYLLVFAVDEHGHVYWYYPAWTDPEAPPSAVPIARSDAAVALPDAVSHDFDSTRVELFAAFGDEPYTVTDVEARLARLGGKTAGFTLPNAVLERRALELSP